MFSNHGASGVYVENRYKENIKKIVAESLMLFFVPWMILLTLFVFGVVDGYVHGVDMRDGGATRLFQVIGLYPHETFIVISCVFGFGVLLVLLESFLPIMAALSYVLQKTRYGPIYQAFIQFVKDHRHIAAALTLAVFVGISFVVIPVHSVKTPAAPSAMTKQAYSRVLLALPNMRHAISGDAQVKQVGAHTYLVKMVPDHR